MGFKRFDPEDFLVSADSVSSTVWSSNQPTLSTFFTSSTQANDRSGDYYLSVFQTASSEPNAEVQFDIAYANSTGGGGLAYNSDVSNISPTATIYGQYRSMVLEDENSAFSFGSVEQTSFYVVNVARARYKEKLLPGSLNLELTGTGAGASTLYLTDNSKDVTLPLYYGTQRAYQIVSGSNGSAYTGSGYAGENGLSTTVGSYGLFLPDTSTLLLNADALEQNNQYGINLLTTSSANVDAKNPAKLFDRIKDAGSFKLNCEETITSDFVFVRARNSEFNYSENPSFISGSTGEVIYPYFIDNPQVYPTTVGLYNDSNELLAVAKLSRPIQKDFTKEALVRVKLDF